MYEYHAQVVRWIDADTVVLHIDQGFRDWKHNQHIRLINCWAPERNTIAGQIAKARAEELAPPGSRVWIGTRKETDANPWEGTQLGASMERYLGDVRLPGSMTTIASILVQEGLATLRKPT